MSSEIPSAFKTIYDNLFHEILDHISNTIQDKLNLDVSKEDLFGLFELPVKTTSNKPRSVSTKIVRPDPNGIKCKRMVRSRVGNGDDRPCGKPAIDGFEYCGTCLKMSSVQSILKDEGIPVPEKYVKPAGSTPSRTGGIRKGISSTSQVIGPPSSSNVNSPLNGGRSTLSAPKLTINKRSLKPSDDIKDYDLERKLKVTSDGIILQTSENGRSYTAISKLENNEERELNDKEISDVVRRGWKPPSVNTDLMNTQEDEEDENSTEPSIRPSPPSALNILKGAINKVAINKANGNGSLNKLNGLHRLPSAPNKLVVNRSLNKLGNGISKLPSLTENGTSEHHEENGINHD